MHYRKKIGTKKANLKSSKRSEQHVAISVVREYWMIFCFPKNQCVPLDSNLRAFSVYSGGKVITYSVGNEILNVETSLISPIYPQWFV